MSDLHSDRALRGAARRGRPEGVCPDAAALASYVDRSLSPTEHAALEAHVASCAACIEHLALLQRWMRRRRPPTRRTRGHSSGSSGTGAGWCRWPPSCWWSPSGCVCRDRAKLRSQCRRRSPPKHPSRSHSLPRPAWRAFAEDSPETSPPNSSSRMRARDSMPSASWKRRDRNRRKPYSCSPPRPTRSSKRSATKKRPTSERTFRRPAFALLQLPPRHRRRRQRRGSPKRRSLTPERGPNRGRLRMPRLLPPRRKTRRCRGWRRRWPCRRPRE